jgi:hypothetical protein
MLTSDVIGFYSGLLIVQFASLGNAVGTVQAYIGELLQDQIILQVSNAFDLDTAIGEQLNILGSYRGVYRQVFGLAAGSYWSLIPYTDPAPNSYFGWATYTGAAPTDLWLQYSDATTFSFSSTMSDHQMRRLIKFLAMLQGAQFTLGTIDQILYATFGTYVTLVDNENMTITYQHQAADPDPDGFWGVAVLANAIPHPNGVLFNIVTT